MVWTWLAVLLALAGAVAAGVAAILSHKDGMKEDPAQPGIYNLPRTDRVAWWSGAAAVLGVLAALAGVAAALTPPPDA
jgi:hypothetical protein